jgi:hypothetical protein
MLFDLIVSLLLGIISFFSVAFMKLNCEAWSLTLSEEHKFIVFENTVVRKILGPKRDKVRGDWRRLNREWLYDLYSSPNIIRVIKSRTMRWAGHVAGVGERRGA